MKNKIITQQFVRFIIIFQFCLACLALQTENIAQKITQSIFVFGNFVKQNKKWDEKLIEFNSVQ
jgi:hypothetical protein